METKRNHLIWLDAISVLGALAVVMLHVSTFWGYSPTMRWYVSTLVECLLRVSVPLFFMISGINLINYRKRDTTREYLLKRFKKAVLPFLFWSLVAYVLFNIKDNHGFAWFGLTDIVDSVVLNKNVAYFWFFFPLFSLYLAMPILSLIPEEKRVPIFWYAIALCLLLADLLPRLFALCGWTWSPALMAPFAIASPGITSGTVYGMLGICLMHTKLNKKQIQASAIGWVLLSTLLFVGTVLLSRNNDTADIYFIDYSCSLYVLYSGLTFVLLRELFTKIKSGEKAAALLAKFKGYTFGMYLLQVFPITLLTAKFWDAFASLRTRWICVLFVWTSCFAATWVLKKIPVLKRLV